MFTGGRNDTRYNLWYEPAVGTRILFSTVYGNMGNITGIWLIMYFFGGGGGGGGGKWEAEGPLDTICPYPKKSVLNRH